MNFPATGGISDDAQFFFEDYNFYYNATQNRPPVQVVTSAAQPVHQVTNGVHTPAQSDLFLSSANEMATLTQASPTLVNGQNGHDFDFSTVIGNAIGQDQGQNGYEMTLRFENQVQNGHLPEQQEHGRQRAQSSESEDKRRSSKSSSNKVCRVCGDKALGYNFNVVTCESCKAFFRRNALKKKKLQCPFQNRCTITVSSRRYCQKCRLRKCFEVGMKAEYIMTEEQRAQKRQRLLERETLESNGVVPPTPGSVQFLDEFFTSDNNEERRRLDSMSSTKDIKPVLNSPQSSTASSGTYQQDGSINGGHLSLASTNIPDVAAWVNDIPPQQNPTLSSPQEQSTVQSSFSASYENEDDMITIRIPKSALLGILFNNNDRTQQMTALGQAVVASASSSIALSSNPTVFVDGRTSKCTCPCTCGYTKTHEEQSKSMDLPSAAYAMDVEQMYGGLTAESQMAYSSMGDNFVLFPIQEEQNPLEPTQLSLSSLSMNDNTDNQVALCPTSNVNEPTFSAAPVQQSPSMELDWEILTTLTNAFEVDWQIPIPFPTLADFHSKYAKLDELLMANEEWNQVPRTVCPLKGSTASDISPEDFFNLIHYGLRCIIKQHKRLSAFTSLAIEDQQALLKASVHEMMILRTVMKFDTRSNHIQIQYPGREYITLELAKRIRGGVYEEYKQLVTFFPDKWRRDETLMLILTAVVLFNPETPNLTNKAAVESIRESYLQLLKEYLESTYGASEAKQAYAYLLDCMQQLRPWASNYCIRVVFELEPNTMEPMLLEIFDFK